LKIVSNDIQSALAAPEVASDLTQPALAVYRNRAMNIVKKLAKRVIPGVSWQNPWINLILKALDPIDLMVRIPKGLGHLPIYSIRVRSNGITKQFGGRYFAKYGKVISNILQEKAFLNHNSNVLEIGCGCGRIAVALAEILDEGNYTGIDIEKVALSACKTSNRLIDKKFKFDFMDIYNREYNPEGKYLASHFDFPFKDENFDIIFLISVFTHMVPDDISNYIKEICRMVKRNGFCMFSAFLMDYGTMTHGLSFPFHDGECHFYNQIMPEISVGYYSSFFINEFAKHGMSLACGPSIGSWRNDPYIKPSSEFSQDILLFTRG
jgi:ubiquinone/menaquinone biosynthesis C-methylase UbiE